MEIYFALDNIISTTSMLINFLSWSFKLNVYKWDINIEEHGHSLHAAVEKGHQPLQVSLKQFAVETPVHSR